MSRIGKLPIVLSAGVTVHAANGGEVKVHSSKGDLLFQIPPVISVKVEEGRAVITRSNDEPQTRAWHGLYRMLIANAVKGLSSGWSKTLVMKGVGYKAKVQGQSLDLNLGYSHPILMDIPKGLEVKVVKNNITVSGIDKALVGQFCAKIRQLREPEPYLGKGIHYSDEIIRRKAGKSGGEKSK